jgi:hypothetical protein
MRYRNGFCGELGAATIGGLIAMLALFGIAGRWSLQARAVHAAQPVGSVAFTTNNCNDCVVCTNQPDYHNTNANPKGSYANPHSDCIQPDAGSCGHPACTKTADRGISDTLTALAVQSAIGNKAALIRLATAFPGYTTLNRGRSSLQVKLPCTGDAIMANLPLTSGQLQVIAALTSTPHRSRELASR